MRDFTVNSLIKAIVEVVAHFPVYRSYINSFDVKDKDRQYIEVAVSKAKRKNPAISGSIFDYLRDVLLLKFPDYLSDEDRQEWLDFVMRFQQLTGPVMAKGVEDTTFYVYNRLVSLNEVGGSPERFGNSLDTFHGQNIERSKFWPHALITSSTHDSKRGEDVRARINVLSEIPLAWRERLYAWGKMNRPRKTTVEGQPSPDRNEEYLLYQTLIGVWPMEPLEGSVSRTFKERIKAYMVKAMREAKVNSSWISPNLLHEEAVMLFIDAIMEGGTGNDFLEDFRSFQQFISWHGMFNSLSQVLLKITSPGVADFYQGTELWDLTLVDPDNRRPVDYNVRMSMLEEIKKREGEVPLKEVAHEMLARMETGMVKLFVVYKALNNRKANRALYENGRYRFLHVTGVRGHNVCAFSRRLGDNSSITAVPRFLTRLIDGPFEMPLGKEIWMETMVAVPADGPGISYRNVFTGEILETANHGGVIGIPCASLFNAFPIALLERLTH
jgi:(1->4)-alpha-D-glucan 1-alpha-D-glucosylmutase